MRHIERCGALALVIDLSAGTDGGTAPRAAAQLRTLRQELDAYDQALVKRPMLVVGTKLDVPGARAALAGLRRSAQAAALPPPMGVSAVTGEGLTALRDALLQLARIATAPRVSDKAGATPARV